VRTIPNPESASLIWGPGCPVLAAGLNRREMSRGAEMKICVVSLSKNAYSETFIRAHIDERNAVAVFEDGSYYEHAG